MPGPQQANMAESEQPETDLPSERFRLAKLKVLSLGRLGLIPELEH